MPLSNAEYEWEFIKALLSDPYNPEASVLLRLETTDWTTANRPIADCLRRVYTANGSLDPTGFIPMVQGRGGETDPRTRDRILDLIAEVRDVPFNLPRMAQEVLRHKNETLARQKLHEALNGPSEALGSAIAEAGRIMDAAPGVGPSPTLTAEWANIANGQPILTPDRSRPSLCFGLPGIDRVLQSGPGNVGVIAAKPSAGKSSLALQSALLTARSGLDVLFLGLEMPREELAARAIAWETGVDSFDLIRGHVPTVGEPPDWIPRLHVYDRIPKGSFDEASRLIRKATGDGIRTIIVDYWTLIYPPDTKIKGAGSAYVLGEMSRGFKQLARELKIHIVLVSQFNREAREAVRPTLENLRETGQLEQDASWVVMMWNDKAEFGPYDPRNVWVELQKNRGGPRWVKVYTTFHPQTGRLYEVEAPAGGNTWSRNAIR